jgi:hypothetical protein
MPTYIGACHCGAVRFRFDSEPIATGLRCNCSLCARRGAVMSSVYFPPEAFTVEGRESLALYRWGDLTVNHYFCRTCGIYLFHEPIATPGHFRVNLGCLEGFDPGCVVVTFVDGRAF